MEIKFSVMATGACPLCRKYNNCKILSHMTECFSNTFPKKTDQALEAVIYRCPDFVEM